MLSFESRILPLQYMSKCITFPEWISLFTLCFAPLLVHIASGAPPVSYLTVEQPKWYEYLCHYNPTSILWRYAAIADRRIRARDWSRNDIAATNAIFWTAKGWDGREEMIAGAAPLVIRLPEHTRVQLLSMSMAKTIITALQGCSAIYSLVGVLIGLGGIEFHAFMGLDMIFFPIAVLGLLRLCAAAWLVEDFAYALPDDRVSKAAQLRSPNATLSGDRFVLLNSHDDLDPFLESPLASAARFISPNSSWTSCAFRACYLSMVGGMWTLSLVFLVPNTLSGEQSVFTLTSFLVALFYFIFTTTSLILYMIYFVRGRTTETLLPCSSMLWYKIYTLFLTAFVLLIIVVASIETNKAPSGKYFSGSLELDLNCDALENWWILSSGFSAFGIVSTVSSHRNASHMPPSMVVREVLEQDVFGSLYWVQNVSAYCVGKLI